MKIKGELFSTDMVKAFLENRKIRTSRPIKPKYGNTHFEHRTDKYGTEFVEMQNDVEGETWGKNPDGSTWNRLLGYIVPKPKYQPGDIMYARETWCRASDVPAYEEYHYSNGNAVPVDEFCYKAGSENPDPTIRWHPSIHMPREAARLFLRVTDVKAQNIADMTEQDAVEDGFEAKKMDGGINRAKSQFEYFWQTRYGTEYPWMWVYTLEKISREEALKDESAEN